MLHYQTIESTTLELLKKIQNIPFLKNTNLVGGTALALQIGHRTSIDLDFFGKIDYETFNLQFELNDIGIVNLLKDTKHIKTFLVNEIKVDFVNYPYKWIDNPVYEDNIILAGLKDIAAMKLSAITGRGTKKDFIDLYFLLNFYSLEEIFNFYKEKYPDGSEFLVIKSLTYFTDAENTEMPYMFEKTEWEEVKNKIISEVKKIC